MDIHEIMQEKKNDRDVELSEKWDPTFRLLILDGDKITQYRKDFVSADHLRSNLDSADQDAFDHWAKEQEDAGR